jgi:hypothetical protein
LGVKLQTNPDSLVHPEFRSISSLYFLHGPRHPWNTEAPTHRLERSSGHREDQKFRPEKRNASGLQPRGDLMKEVKRPMGQVTVKWGKLHIELPGEVFLALLFKAFLIAHSMSG